MAVNLSYSVRNSKANADVAALGNSAVLTLYTGTQPAGPDTALSGQTALVSLTCGAPFAGAASSGVVTANAIASGAAIASGTATWGRFYTSGGTTAVMDADVGVSGASINLATTTIASGVAVSITSLTLTEY